MPGHAPKVFAKWKVFRNTGRKTATNPASLETQLAEMVATFSPAIASLIRAARRQMQVLVPHATEMVFDNYNFLVIGYAPNEKSSLAIFSLAAQAMRLSLCFLPGAGLPDPQRQLRGSGNVVRNIPLVSVATLDQPAVLELIRLALERAKVAMAAGAAHRLIIKSVCTKQRPRRLVSAKVG